MDYITHIGKKFVQEYNQKYQTNHTGETFFKDVFYDLILIDYETAKEKEFPSLAYRNLLNFKNGFCILNNQKGFLREKGENVTITKERVVEQIRKLGSTTKIANHSQQFDSKELGATLTGVTKDFYKNEDYFYTIIGELFGIRLTGAYIFFVDDADLRMKLFESIPTFREEVLEGNLAVTLIKSLPDWFAHFLNFSTDEFFDINSPLPEIMTREEKSGKPMYKKLNWVYMLMLISDLLEVKQKTIYVYSEAFKSQNTFLGYVHVNFESFKTAKTAMQSLFNSDEIGLTKEDFMSYTKFKSFKFIAENKRVGFNSVMLQYTPKLGQKNINSKMFLLFIKLKLTMNLQKSAKDFAKILQGVKATKSQRTHIRNLVSKILESKGKNTFQIAVMDLALLLSKEGETDTKPFDDLLASLENIRKEDFSLFVKYLEYNYKLK